MTNNAPKIVHVVGHRNPDTDSVCSAIGYAHFKNLTDKRFLFAPARAGKLNEETVFVLKRFGVPAPNELESLTPTVSDLEMKRPISVMTGDSVQALAHVMREKGVRALPVVDETGRLAGMVGLKDIASHYMDSVGFTDIADNPISLDILIRTLDARMVSNTKKAGHLAGRIITASMQKGTILNRVRPGDIVIIGDLQDIQLDVIRIGCSAVIVVDGMPISQEVIAAAEAQDTILISSPHSAFATVQLMTMSEPVSSIMSADAQPVGIYTPIAELRQRILDSEYRSAVVVDSDNRLIGFVTRTNLLTPVRKRAILVDHNEISQAVDGIEEAEIIEIIDHHRVGDISTVAPIYVYNDPIGSTCTVVAGMMFLYQVHIPAEIAGVLLSGILSDTLLLTLSTTTERDRQAAHRLGELAGVSVQEYGKELLHASINTEGKTAAELIEADFKEFVISGRRLGVSQMMVLDCGEIDLREEELLAELERLRATHGYDLAVLLVTNPLSAKQERVLLRGETWIVEKAFNVKVEDGTCILPRVLSRKKDFIPAIGLALSMAGPG
ncbi:MAG: putative manganese-dependent inorganic diphosphatase [Nitrospiraceae bacterium]|nr:putative manganese-dependent inorganic diphosphatase [Nitrospiraceae bacterium]